MLIGGRAHFGVLGVPSTRDDRSLCSPYTPRLSHIGETSVAEICFQLLRKRVSPKYGIPFKITEAKDNNVPNNFRLDYVMNLS